MSSSSSSRSPGQKARKGAALLAATLLAGCGHRLGTRIDRLPADAPAQGYVLVKPVSLSRGQVSYDCGAESLAAILGFWGRPTDVENLAHLLVSPHLKSTPPSKLTDVAQKKGLVANFYGGGSVGLVKKMIDKSQPPIIMVQVAKDLFHYYVVSGYNDRSALVVCEDYEGKKMLYTYEEMDVLWKPTNYLLIELYRAAAADEFDVGSIAEQNGDYPTAIEHYKRALKDDPEFFEAHNGLGNCYYFQGKLQEARGEYEAAHKLNPSDAKVCNNLANILLDLHLDLDIAEDLAGKAVDSYMASCKELAASLETSLPEREKNDRKKDLNIRTEELAYAQGTLGQARFALEKFALAVAAWKASLDGLPLYLSDVRAKRHYEIGLASRKLAMDSEARAHFGRALEIVKDPKLKALIEEAIK